MPVPRLRRGDSVVYQRWDDSDHVGHYKRYPAAYTAAVSIFLNRVLSEHAPAVLEGTARQAGLE